MTDDDVIPTSSNVVTRPIENLSHQHDGWKEKASRHHSVGCRDTHPNGTQHNDTLSNCYEYIDKSERVALNVV